MSRFVKSRDIFKYISTLCRNLIDPILNQLRILNIVEKEEYKNQTERSPTSAVKTKNT